MVVRVCVAMYNIDMHLFHKREFNEKMDGDNMVYRDKWIRPSVSLNSEGTIYTCYFRSTT